MINIFIGLININYHFMILIKHPKYLTQLIIILSNAKYKHTKVVPVVSIDVNNLPTVKLSDESSDFIFHDIDNYKQDILEGILNS